MPVMYTHNSQTSAYAAFRERLDVERVRDGLPPATTLEALAAYRADLGDLDDRAQRMRRTGERFVRESEHSTMSLSQQEIAP